MLPRLKILPSLARLAGATLLGDEAEPGGWAHGGLKTWTLLRGTARIAHWTLPPQRNSRPAL